MNRCSVAIHRVRLLLSLLIIVLCTASLPARGVTAETPAPPPQQADAATEPGGFIQVQGSQLLRLGKPVVIKGVNYYPRGKPWRDMWSRWDAPSMQHELQLAKDQLGINTVRVLLPLSVETDQAVERLRELVQIAGRLEVRLIVTLFDFHNDFPAPGSSREAGHIAYLERLIGNFAGDDRILAWDVHNEPDNYDAWKLDGKAQDVLMWLGRMADTIKRIAPNHLVTVGMGHYDNLWQPGPDGRRVIDYSDVVSIHIYNPEDAVRQLAELGQYTDKPILIEEFGWPSGPYCAVRAYNEADQEQVYRMVLEAARSNPQVVGVVAWTLRDFHAGPTMRWDTREEYYGLFRPDDSLKPAAAILREYAASPLPALTTSTVPLTRSGNDELGGRFAPRLIEETGFYVKGWYRRAWEDFGGAGMFGFPIGEAYVRPEDERVVQYFEAAVVEFYPELASGPDFAELPWSVRIRRALKPVNLGQAYTAGREFPQLDDIPEGARYFAETGYTLQGDFRRFYEGAYGEWRLGPPISEALTETINGVPTRVQYFVNGRLEVNPSTGVMQYGQLGVWAQEIQCRYAR